PLDGRPHHDGADRRLSARGPRAAGALSLEWDRLGRVPRAARLDVVCADRQGDLFPGRRAGTLQAILRSGRFRGRARHWPAAPRWAAADESGRLLRPARGVLLADSALPPAEGAHGRPQGRLVPAKSRRQQRFMGAELARARAGKKTKTGMSIA